jgi:hypothetical protein
VKLLKLTNAFQGREGQGLLLNIDLIASFYEHTDDKGRTKVVAYGLNGNSWEVSESLAEIMAQAKE